MEFIYQDSEILTQHPKCPISLEVMDIRAVPAEKDIALDTRKERTQPCDELG